MGRNDRKGSKILLFVGAALILSMTTWFSAAAILDDLKRNLHLADAATSWVTNSLQIGFVVGALGLSISGLVDVIPVRTLMVASALLAALSNLAIIAAPNAASLFAARIVTGIALAGIYQPALKVIASWFVAARGLAMGATIGALTLGSAGPYLIRALGAHADWRVLVIASSAAALVSAILLLGVEEGPHGAPPPPFDPRRIGTVLRDPSLMLANLGYFGHMWELYAMWGWFLAFADATRHDHHPLPMSPALLTFLVIAIGAAGCVAGGWLADCIGRAATAGAMLAISGFCAGSIGFAAAGPPWLFVAVALVWGFSVIADSAQFSALVTDLADADTRGAALALQIGIGFALTVVSIRLMPLVAGAIGWRWTFLVLVPGPLVGACAMARLVRRPAARQKSSASAHPAVAKAK